MQAEFDFEIDESVGYYQEIKDNSCLHIADLAYHLFQDWLQNRIE